jgi:hypothetical protein
VNSKRLARHYDTLSARERVSLLFAANVRGDKVEAERLLESAPREVWRVPHHQTLAETLCDMSLVHQARLLEAAALFWKTDSLREANDHDAQKGPDRDNREFRLLALLRRLATEMQSLREGWARFCAELQIDPDAPLRDLPGYAITESTAKLAAIWAFTEEEKAAMWTVSERVPWLTPDDVHADYRGVLEAREGGGAQQ